ncbi:MAG: 2'-5' RNA ligase family protein [Anaerolineales bacterium]|nr:2'-5' RNA ligase family protein [Anaerolineales bacterium]
MKINQALLSLLDIDHERKVKKIWMELKETCGLKSIQEVIYPHFSWHVALDYDCDALEINLKELVKQIHPFVIRTEGLGIFSGSSPVLFIPIVKTRELVDLHQLIWDTTTNFVETGLNPLYSPDFWIPHITLAIEDTNTQNIGKAVEYLSNWQFNWEIRIDNLSFLYCLNAPEITLNRIQLTGKEKAT